MVGFVPQIHAMWHLLIFLAAWNTSATPPHLVCRAVGSVRSNLRCPRWRVFDYLFAGSFLDGLTCFEESIPPQFWRLQPFRYGVGSGVAALADDWVLVKSLDVVI
jgi:hypothetical protein